MSPQAIAIMQAIPVTRLCAIARLLEIRRKKQLEAIAKRHSK